MNTKHLQHLFLRAGFGIGYDELKSLTSKTKEKIVKELFLNTKRSTPLEIDLSELETLLKVNYNKSKGKMDAESMMDLKKKSRAKVKELNYAWLERLADPSSVLNENSGACPATGRNISTTVAAHSETMGPSLKMRVVLVL